MQNRNTYTEIEDFLEDPSFQLWVRSNIDQNGWEDWTLENPKRAKLVEEARMWLLAMKVPETNLTSLAIESALQSTWTKIDLKNREVQKSRKSVFTLYNKSIFKKIAAVFVFGLISSWFYSNYIQSNTTTINYQNLVAQNNPYLLEQTNNSQKPQIITLSDGSSVLLQPNSKLSYPKIFNGKDRKVYLSGEGFFEISKNPQKPFYVYANEIVTKVVGTSFRIKAFPDDSNVEVLVRTGVVKVSSNRAIEKFKNQEIALLPNQAIRLERKNLIFTKITDITQDEILSKMASNSTIEQLSFEFTDIPLAQIFKTIEQAYLVDIDFPKDKLKDCHLTTSLSDEPLPEKLKIICKSIGNESSYIMNGNQITILSDGCY